MAIIDHEELMAQKGATDETMPLRAIKPVADTPGSVARFKPRPNQKTPEERGLSFSEREEQVEQMVKQWRYRFQPGPLSTTPIQTLGGRLSIKNPRMQDIPRDQKPEGVEEESSDEDTSTFALPAVWKMTGKPSTNKLAHRSAAHVQQVFNEAGWNIAVWYGEATKQYWVMDESGLHEFDSITAMYQGMGWEAL